MRKAGSTARNGRHGVVVVAVMLVIVTALTGATTASRAWALSATGVLRATSQQATEAQTIIQPIPAAVHPQSAAATSYSMTGAGWNAPSPALYPSGGVFSFGDAFSPSANLANQSLGPSIVGGAASTATTSGAQGLYLADSNGSIYTFGDAVYYGSLANATLGSASFPAPIVGMAETPSGKGYYLVGSNGSIYTFGDAVYYGSLGGVPLYRLSPSANAVSAIIVTPDSLGYWIVETDGTTASPDPSAGGIYSFGLAKAVTGQLASVVLSGPAVAVAGSSISSGMWLVDANGKVTALGGVPWYGSLSGYLPAPIVGMAVTSSGKGYYLVGADGSVYTFGNAVPYGSLRNVQMGSASFPYPIVGMAETPSGKGYYLVGSNGSIYTFGDAVYYGSLGGIPLGSASFPAPIVGMTVTPSGNGYYLVGSNGSIYTFGDAVYYGSLGGIPLGSASFPAPIVGMAETPSGKGYYLVGSNGSIYTFGDAVYYGSLGGVNPDVPVSGMALSATGLGYWLLSPEGIRTTFPPSGRIAASGLGETIVGTAASQIAPAITPGTFCNPYGPCEPWCALFATWVWEQAGIQIPLYPFVGSVYDWGASNGYAMAPSSLPQPGDAILYGTGPQTTQTAVHMGIVAQVWPDGFIDTIEGDAGPGNNGEYGVIINGPFLPSFSSWYNGFPVFAYVAP